MHAEHKLTSYVRQLPILIQRMQSKRTREKPKNTKVEYCAILNVLQYPTLHHKNRRFASVQYRDQDVAHQVTVQIQGMLGLTYLFIDIEMLPCIAKSTNLNCTEIWLPDLFQKDIVLYIRR